MDVTAYIVDWNEVVKRYRAGSLANDVCDAWENDEPWIRDLEFGTDSDSAYIAIAQAYEELRETLAPSVRAVADSFFTPLITLEGYQQDLKDKGSMFSISISPESAARFAAIADRLDLEALREAFAKGCSEGTIAELGEGDTDAAFNDNFLPYLQDWIDAVKRAAREKKGICFGFYGE